MYEKCVICSGQFDTLKLQDGKCVYCKTNYPNAESYEEAVKQSVPQKEQMMTLTEDRVRAIVKEELEKFTADIAQTGD